jgi:murein DD-endopeptidase MepM/ murein hydrolase activator NlpD
MNLRQLKAMLAPSLAITVSAGTIAVSVGAGVALAEPPATAQSAEPAPPPAETTVPAPQPAPPAAPAPAAPAGTTTAGTTPSVTGSTPTASPPTATNPAPTVAPTTTTTTVPAPMVRRQSTQPRTGGSHARGGAPAEPTATERAGGGGGNAVPPSAITPPLPSALGGSLAGVPSFFINSFSIPPFLLPIYQAAGAAYGIPWQVLAAINEVETDYGRDLSVSSAGAEGWMQFLPSEWGSYGVDVNNDGFEDPYNPADAIFAAARYLKDAGGDTDIRGAVFAYNHSQAYVDSVMLRARLLGGTPPELLDAVTGLTEARFPVYAAAHYNDAFPTTEGASPHTVAGTTIYSQAGAPVIAVGDGRIVRIERVGPLGRSISLRDAYGNTYTYAELGSLATLYPVLEARESAPPSRARGTLAGSALSASAARPLAGSLAPVPAGSPAGSALAGSLAPAVAGSAARPLARARGPLAGSPAPAVAASAKPAAFAGAAARGATRVFREGAENVYLHPLRVGVRVIAGTVLGHLAPGAQPHVVFQIRPAGAGAPLIDPKPILDGWVKLQSSSVVRAKGRRPFAKLSPTPGQALLESKTQLEQQVPRDRGIHLPVCERHLIADGRGDRRVLAALEFLSVSGLEPTVSARSCAPPRGVLTGAPAAIGVGGFVDISAIAGARIAGAGAAVAAAVRKLEELQGVMRPLQVASAARLPGLHGASPEYRGVLHVAFDPLSPQGGAHAAGGFGGGLSPAQWLKLIARLGEVPDPEVSPKPSPAAIPIAPKPAAGGSN